MYNVASFLLLQSTRFRPECNLRMTAGDFTLVEGIIKILSSAFEPCIFVDVKKYYVIFTLVLDTLISDEK